MPNKGLETNIKYIAQENEIIMTTKYNSNKATASSRVNCGREKHKQKKEPLWIDWELIPDNNFLSVPFVCGPRKHATLF